MKFGNLIYAIIFTLGLIAILFEPITPYTLWMYASMGPLTFILWKNFIYFNKNK